MNMFADRVDAARQLARELWSLDLHDPIVLAIPRGGVVGGVVLAQELDADLDVVLARKLWAPHQPMMAIGAIGENGGVHLNHRVAAAIGVTEDFDAEERKQLQEIGRQCMLFRSVHPRVPITGRSVVLTDDRIETGSTMIAAIDVIQGQKPKEVIVAVPIALPYRLALLRRICDRLICLQAPETFHDVAHFHRSFDRVEDIDVVRMLREYSPATQQTG
jgi:hypothetical protein